MSTPRVPGPWSFPGITSIAAVALAAACDAAVDPIGGGPRGSGGADGSATGLIATSTASQGGADAGGSSAVGGAGPTSVALFESELGTGVGGNGEGGVGTSSVGVASVGAGNPVGAGGAPAGGERLLVVVSRAPTACSDPFAPCSGGPRAFILLPADGQEPGASHLLSSLDATYSESVLDGDECGTGSGSFFDGTIDVLEADSSSLVVRLSNTAVPSLDGDHDVTRCAPLAPATRSAIAYFDEDLPSGAGGAGTTTATGGGERPLRLRFADHPTTCAVPFPSAGPGETLESLRVSLPLELVTEGASYPLADLECLYGQLEEMSAATGSNPSEPGTITFSSVTATEITVTVTGNGRDFVEGVTLASRCDG